MSTFKKEKEHTEVGKGQECGVSEAKRKKGIVNVHTYIKKHCSLMNHLSQDVASLCNNYGFINTMKKDVNILTLYIQKPKFLTVFFEMSSLHDTEH